MKDRILNEIEMAAERAKENLKNEVRCLEEQINEILKKYNEVLKELPELSKVFEKDIVFVKTIDIDESWYDNPPYYSPIKFYFRSDGFNIEIFEGEGWITYNIPREKGLKLKIVVYKD